MKYILSALLALLTGPLNAHEMTPTWFEMRPSLYNNVYVTDMSLFNKREDVNYYEVGVFDKDFKPVAFATSNRIINAKTYSRNAISIYVRKKDLDDVMYICTESKLLKGEVESTGVTSRICSKKK